MIKVFLDSSALVAASASKKGASAFILGYSKLRKIQTFISLDCLGETRKNVNLKLGKAGRGRLVYYLKFARLRLVLEPSLEEIATCEKVINKKDAPILAAAKKSGASFLVTLDRKHFFNSRVINFAKPMRIITPGEFVTSKTRSL